MDSSFIIYLKYFTVLQLLLILFYYVGHLLFSFVKHNESGSFFNFFSKSIAGLILCISLFSLITTGFKSINILFIPILFFLLFRVRNELHFTFNIYKLLPKISGPVFLTVFLYSIFIFSFVFYFEYSTNKFDIPHTFFDTIFYSKVADYIYLTGSENVFQEANLIDTSFHGATTYHYFELWLTNFAAVNFKLLTLLSLKLITVPLMAVYICIGFLSVLEIYKKIIWYDKIIIFFFLFSAGIQWSYFDKFNFIELLSSSNKYPILSFLTPPKILLQTIFLMLSIVLLLKKKLNLYIFPLLCFPIINISTVPAIYGTTCIIILISIIWNISNSRIYAITDFFGLFVISLFFLLFYRLLKPDLNYVEELNIINIVINNIKSFYPTKINYIIGIIIAFFTYYILYVLFCLSNFKFNIKLIKSTIHVRILLLMTLSALIIALITISLLSGVPDFYQFYGNIYMSIMYIIPILLFVSVHIGMKKVYKIVFSILILIVCSFNFYKEVQIRNELLQTNYSTDFFATVNSKLFNIQNPLGACIYTVEDKFNGPPGHNKLGWYLKYMYNYYNTVNISTYDISKTANSNLQLSELKHQPYYSYVVQQNSSNNSSKSTEELKLDFLKKYKIEYMIVSSYDTIPMFMLPYIAEEIVDSISGEKFVVFNNLAK